MLSKKGLYTSRIWHLGLICDPDQDWGCKSRLWLSFESSWLFFHFFYSALSREVFMLHVRAWCTAEKGGGFAPTTEPTETVHGCLHGLSQEKAESWA